MKTNLWKNFDKLLRAACLSTAIFLLLATGVSLLVQGTAYAQSANATIRGQVLDPTGALVAKARVVIVNQDTNATVYDGQSDSAGVFVAPSVVPGSYRVTVTFSGMEKAVVSNVIASVAQVSSVTVNLTIGSSTNTVTVTATSEQLDPTTSNVSTLVEPSDVASLPLTNRAPENLLVLIPGVTHGGSGDSPNTAQLSINGSRTQNTEILLNGVSILIASTGGPIALPSPDGIDELRFLTENAPAEYGRTSGAVLSANLRSGTNSYHGNIYSLVRNEDMDANLYFNKLYNVANAAKIAAGTAIAKGRPRDRFFQEGASLGGPVWLGRLYNGHDKSFFFVNYDRTIQTNQPTITATVPSANFRAGNFSAATGYSIYQPGSKTSAAYANNTLTSIDPAAAKIMALLPLPNSVGTPSTTVGGYSTGNYVIAPITTTDITRLVARGDQQVTVNDRVSMSLYRNLSHTPNAIDFNNALLNDNYDCVCSNAWVASVDYARIWSPSLVTDLNMGFFRFGTFRNSTSLGSGVSAATGIASLPLDEMPNIVTTGYNQIGSTQNDKQVNITNTFSPFGSVTKTWKTHTFKIGASLHKNEFNSYNPATYPNGQFNFNGSITNHGSAGNVVTQLADFLTGSVYTANYELPQPPTGRRNYNFATFLQDDWKVNSKLTLNAGLRYEFESPMTVSNNIYSRIDSNSATGTLLVAGGNASRSLNINTAKANFSPRIGLAYSLNSKTVIRAAFGTFYGMIMPNLGGQIAYPGFDVSQSFLAQATAVAQPFSLSQGFPTPFAVPNLSNPGANVAVGTDKAPYAITGNQFGDLSHIPIVQQYNAGFQRQLPLAITLEANFIGNHGVHLPTNYPRNVVPLASQDAVGLANTTQAQQDSRPFPTLSTYNETSNGGDSHYDALQVTVRRQFNSNLAVLSNYTWAKSIDDASVLYNSSAPNGIANAQWPGVAAMRNMDRSVSSIDVKHTLNIGVVYTTSGPKWIKGYQLSSIFVGHTGLPINLMQTTEEINAGQQRPNGVASSIKQTPVVNGSVIQYLQIPTTTGYSLTPSGPIYATISGTRTELVFTNTTLGGGNISRNALRAPGEVDFDTSFKKDFDLFRALKFQLRVDAFNVLNHTNLAAPTSANMTLGVATPSVSGVTTATLTGNSTFGQISTTQPQRTLQIVGRFTF